MQPPLGPAETPDRASEGQSRAALDGAEAGVDFPVVLQVVAFLVAIWFGGRIMKRLHQPEILGNLFVGIIMGPQLLDIVPYASNGSCDSLGNFRRLSDVAV